MSSREFEDMMEEQSDHALAKELGIEVEDLRRLEIDIEPHTSKDGMIYGYNVEFLEGSDPDVLAKIPGAKEQGWIRIGTY